MSLHVVTVTLENIGGIAIQKDKGGAITAFNVTVAGKRQYSVQMRGEPRLENGMVVTAVLRDTENWQTLAGWLDHATGEICGVDSPQKCFATFMIVSLISAVYAFRWLGDSLGGKMSIGGTILCVVGTLSITGWSLVSWHKSAMVYRLLKP